MLQYFSGTFECARNRFIEDSHYFLKSSYPEIDHSIFRQTADTQSDLIHAKREGNQTLLVLSSGLHGIEGYTGSAMQLRFLEYHLSHLDTGTVDLLLLHGINAYGMKHHRKESDKNINFNRNAIEDWTDADLSNPEFKKSSDLFVPRSVTGSKLEYFPFLFKTIKHLVQLGPKRFMKGATLGQFEFPAGFYYGGPAPDPYFHQILTQLTNRFSAYTHILFLDCHTGFGHQAEVQLVMSSEDPMHSKDVKKIFHYPIVENPREQQFYKIEGEWLNWMYRYTKQQNLGFMGFTVECGTVGKGPIGLLRSLKATIDESRLFAGRAECAPAIRKRFDELYIPSSKQWRKQVLKEADLIFEQMVQFINDPSNHTLMK